ncbi:MAG: cytochrome c-type biogenesis protein CcmH [Anaerolineales bacterium]|jgi:cytochrome c-type biogenesis protein CcmH
MKRLAWIFGILMIFLTLSTWQAYAQQMTPSDDQVNAIASQLFCPVCENTPLDVCQTEACHQWRELIRLMLTQGKSEAEIKQYFVDHYGARVLAEPPATGLNWLVYIIPPAAFLVGVFLLYLAFRTWTQNRTTFPIEGPAIQSGRKIIPESDSSHDAIVTSDENDEYVARLEEELRKQS